MTFNKKGERISSRIEESIILSNHRMTYNQVTAILEGDQEVTKNFLDVKDMLFEMQELCLILDKKRKDNGSIDLDVKEAHIYIDENGEIVIPDYDRSISHKMIEQFMVSANEAVAEIAQKNQAPFLYRIHEQPSPEKASTFFSFLRDLGINAKGEIDDIKPTDYQRILKGVEDKPYSSVVNRVMLRSMQKARYSEENVGHFGLASQCYCHFTSPIRRYPDLFVHRVLKEIIHGELAHVKNFYASIAHESAIDTSERERRADMAERDVDDLYKVVYMSERLGSEYDGVISGVTNFGIFVELANTIEGIIRIENLPQDSYEYFEDKLLLKGAQHSYKIGEPIKIKVAGCDWGSMRVEFAIV
jgi:ribonuclease R